MSRNVENLLNFPILSLGVFPAYTSEKVKGPISDHLFQTSLFPNSQIFFFIFKENNFIIQQLSQKRHIFGKENNSLFVGN